MPRGDGVLGWRSETIWRAVVMVGVSAGRRKRDACAHWVTASRMMLGVEEDERRVEYNREQTKAKVEVEVERSGVLV